MKTYPIEVLSIYGQALSKKEQSILKKSQCIFGGRVLLSQLFPQWESTPQTDKIFKAITSPLSEVLTLMEDYRAQGKKIAVLADGDALYFGMGASLTRHFGVKALRIHAGISIVQRLCAAVAVPWHEVRHVSLHGRSEQKHWQALNIALFSGKPVCVLTDEKANPSVIAKYLLARGVKNWRMHIGENLGFEKEKMHSLTLSNAAKNNLVIEGYCTILLMPTQPCIRPLLGLDASKVAREKNLMTKSSVRAAALSLLRIEPSNTLWDIGSGSGSVALEMCALAYEGHVIAVEKNVSRIKHMEKNRQTMGATILDIVHGDAPQCLVNLPKPHAVFVGGGLSSDNAEDLLRAIYAALPTGGRMVVSCVLLSTLHAVENFLQRQNILMQVLQINVNSSASLGKDIRLVPENPVFLVCAEKG